ncbi:hypothetical protein [Streptomyces sp. NPDC050485]|uniref:hypothetical protein n=1 Tax=Streptomyces sp. NPDC050485 TaxID=3365617 RepID=UPI003799FA89
MTEQDLTRYPCPVEGCDSFLEMTLPMYLDIWTDEDGAAHFTLAGHDQPTYLSCGAEGAHGVSDFPEILVNQVTERLNTAETAMYEEMYG